MNIKHLSCTIQLSTHNSVKYYAINLILIDEETEAERREEWKYNTKQSDPRTPLAHDYHSILPPTHFQRREMHKAVGRIRTHCWS